MHRSRFSKNAESGGDGVGPDKYCRNRQILLEEEDGMLEETCVFCCKPIVEGGEEKEDKNVYQNYLRRIWRYLGVHGEVAVEEMDDFSGITFCVDCAVIVEKLASYCGKMEETQMWITYFLKKLTEVLTRTLNIDDGEDEEGISIKNMVVQTKEKCILKLREHNYPQVFLHRTEKMGDGKLAPVSGASAQKMITVRGNGLSVKTPTPGALKLENPVEEQEIVASSCPFCDETLPNPQALNFHTIEIHPEQLLSSIKNPHVSDQEFQSLCQKLLKKKTSQVEIVNGKVSCLYCPMWFSDKKGLKSHMIDSHLYILTRKLEQLQKDGDKNDNPRASAATVLKPKKTTIVPKSRYLTKFQFKRNEVLHFSSHKSCHVCGKMFNSRLDVKRHVLLAHGLPPVNPMNLPGVSTSLRSRPKTFNRWSTKGCQNSSKTITYRNLLKNKIRSCVMNNQSSKTAKVVEIKNTRFISTVSSGPGIDPSPEIVATASTVHKNDSIPRDEIAWECLECGKTFSTTDGLEYHRTSGCSKEDNVGLKESEKKFKCSQCESAFRHCTSLLRHRRQCHSNGEPRRSLPGRSYPCPYCGKQYTRPSNRNNHIKLNCSAIPQSHKAILVTSRFPVNVNRNGDATKKEPFQIPSIIPSVLQRNVPQSGTRSSSHIAELGNDDTTTLYYDEGGNDDNDVPDHDPLQI